MDLKQLDLGAACDEGATLTLEHPTTGEPLDATIVLYGPDSQVVAKLRREQSDRTLARVRRSGSKRVTAAELELEACQFLATATKSWSGVEEHGQAVPFSYENAVRIYREHRWVREQVDRFVGDRGNFIKG